MPKSLMTVIVPKEIVFTPERMRRALKKGLDQTAQETRAVLQNLVDQWDHDVEFDVKAPKENERDIATEDDIYRFVDEGTKPHIIAPKNARMLRFTVGGSPRTAPNSLTVGPASRGGRPVFARKVRHPGSKARRFSRNVAKKAQKWLKQSLDDAFEREVRG